MFLIRLLLFLPLFPILLLAEEINIELASHELSTSLSCYEEEDQIIELIKDNQSYLIALPYFISSPIINSSIVCQKFLNDLPALLNKQKTTLKLSISPKTLKGTHELTNNQLIKHCVELNYCERDIIDYFKNKSPTKKCYHTKNFSDLLKTWQPKIKRTEFNLIPEVSIELFPFQPFNEKVFAYQPAKNIYASTMSLGGGALKNYKSKFSKTKTKFFLMLDAGLVFTNSQGGLLTSQITPYSNIYAIPMTSGHSFNSLHHWKFIFNDETKDSTLSSMNLTTPERTNYIDAMYNFKDPKVSKELKSLFLNYTNNQCESAKDFECLSEFSTNNRVESRKLKALLERSCTELAQQKTEIENQRYFLTPEDSDVSFAFNKLIDSAKKEIIIITHKFKQDKTYQKLARIAALNKIKVYLFVTSPPPIINPDDNFTFITTKNLLRKIPDPHLKVMLVDRETLWFGTGNMSHNAFYDSSELYGKTKDPQAIQKILEVASVLHAGFSKKITNHFEISKPTENWLYVHENQKWQNSKWGAYVTEKPWLKNYLLLNNSTKDLLKSCQLEHLLIIPESAFTDCVATN